MNNDGGNYPYRSSKAALNMIVKGLSTDLAVRGIIVAALSPGWVQTDMGGSSAKLTPEESTAETSVGELVDVVVQILLGEPRWQLAGSAEAADPSTRAASRR